MRPKAEDYVAGAQLAEKMIGVIAERGWCTGIMCVSEQHANMALRILENIRTGKDEFLSGEQGKLERRTMVGAVCVEGAALVALGYDRPEIEWDSDGHRWLVMQPEWRRLWGEGKDGALEWNDTQVDPSPVIEYLEVRAKELYDRAEMA